MPKNHLKRIAMPKTWPLERKKTVFVTRPNPGGHKIEHSIALNIVLKNMTKSAKTTAEVKSILHNKNILVDGRRRREIKLPVGLFDVISLPDIDEHYRMVFSDKGKLTVVPIKQIEINRKPCKIVDKTLIKKGQVQLNLSDGRNIIVKKDTFKAGDTVIMSVPKQEIQEHIKLEKGVLVYLTGGKNRGANGTVEEFDNNIIKVKAGKQIFETLKEYAFVIGKEKPAVTIK